MKSIQKTISGTLREMGSKFIGFVFYCESESDFQNELLAIKKKYSDASHHCYGYRINPHQIFEFSSDDGEPSGTAGLPILNQLKSFELVNTGAVVVRYFGGTKLGKSGLIQAYGGTIKDILENSPLSEVKLVTPFVIEYEYTHENEIQLLQRKFGFTERKSDYTEKVTKQVLCDPEKANELEDSLEKLGFKNISFQRKENEFQII